MHLTTHQQPPLEACLPPEARAHLALWTARMQHLARLGRGWTSQLASLAAEWGASLGTITRYHYAYQRRGPAGLLDSRKYGKYLNQAPNRGLPPVFVEHWMGLNERFQRNNGGRQSYRMLLEQLKMWRRGSAAHAIPGYPAPPADQPGHLHPPGWSYDNLMRHLPDAAELALARRGRATAKKYLPAVYTTRVGIEPGQVLMIDDQMDDLNVIWSNGQIARPLSFALMDFGSAYEIIHGTQPHLEREEDGTKTGLREQDAFWLILTHLMTNGYRADIGTHIIVERGTATLREEISHALSQATQGKIKVDRGGTYNRGLKGLIFDGPAKGNFKFKASRESSFNLLRNLAGHLIGPTGRNRDEAPDEQFALIKYAEKILKKVPQERWPLLKLPLLTEEQFRELSHYIKEALNHRDWHNLEGWAALKYQKTWFRLPEWSDDHWQPFEALQGELIKLPPDRAELLTLALQSQGERCLQVRKMTPSEVWQQHAHKLTRLTPWHLHLIIPARLAHARPVEDNREIRLYGLGPEIIRYDARCYNAMGHPVYPRPGTQVMVYVNPLHPDQAMACDANGGAIGIINRIPTFTRLDTAGVLRRMGQVKEMTADIEAPVARRAAAVATERRQMIKHNARVVNGLPVTVAEQEAAAKHTRAAKTAAEHFDGAPSPISHLPSPPAPPANEADFDFFDH